MKKFFFPLAIFACMALISSCSSSDDVPPPHEDYNGELPQPTYSEQAAAFDIPLNTIMDQTGKTSLTGINFTESGKAIFEVTTEEGVKYATYNVKIDGDTYTILDKDGKSVGQVQKVTNRASSEVVYITLTITINIAGIPYTFSITESVLVRMIVNAITALDQTTSTNTKNLCRTWSVEQMNIVLEGDVDMSKLEKSGNLEVFVNAAQEAGAGLEPSEEEALRKNIASMTFDKNGLFSIEYSNGQTETCDWTWTDKTEKAIKLILRKNTKFGNKFLSNNSEITVNFTEKSVALTLNTKIEGNKRYTATLTMVLK